MKLNDALICLDCEEIFNVADATPPMAGQVCPACGSSANHQIAWWVPSASCAQLMRSFCNPDRCRERHLSL